jgi:hypothetical protein
MEKNSVYMCLFCVIVITSVLIIIPIYGITTEEKDSTIKQAQWCCSHEEDEKDNYHTLSTTQSSSPSILSTSLKTK